MTLMTERREPTSSGLSGSGQPTPAPDALAGLPPLPPEVPEDRKSSRLRRATWSVLGLLVIGAASYAGWYYYWQPRVAAEQAASAAAAGGPGGAGPGGRRTGPMRAPVVVSAVRETPVNIILTGLGSVSATNTVIVRTRVEGPLVRIAFREGQTIKAGELLAEIDPRPFQVQVAQAEGQLARNQAQLRAAQVELERYKLLLTQDSIAAQQVDTQQSLVRQLEGTLKSDQANVDAARLQLSYTRIVAPIAGRIGLRQVDAGNVVRPSDSTGIVVINQIQPATVVFSVPEQHVPAIARRLEEGGRIPVEAWDRDLRARIAGGALLTLDNQIDGTTGTIKLKAMFRNDDLTLFPNQFVNVRMQLDVVEDALVVPSSAILRGRAGFFVYVVQDDQTVTARAVTPGPVQRTDTSILEGLKVGERVVVDGTDRLREGMTVQSIVRAPPPEPRLGNAPLRRGAREPGKAGPAGQGGAGGAGQRRPGGAGTGGASGEGGFQQRRPGGAGPGGAAGAGGEGGFQQRRPGGAGPGGAAGAGGDGGFQQRRPGGAGPGAGAGAGVEGGPRRQRPEGMGPGAGAAAGAGTGGQRPAQRAPAPAAADAAP